MGDEQEIAARLTGSGMVRVVHVVPSQSAEKAT
jgi:hypothetical protein